jgi:hypothetical protein
MTTTSGLSPEAVPERATRAGETREAMAPHQEWSWVEPQVWTARMLAALIEGVKHVLGPAEGRTRGAANGTA